MILIFDRSAWFNIPPPDPKGLKSRRNGSAFKALPLKQIYYLLLNQC
jgi:hypothetical protein